MKMAQKLNLKDLWKIAKTTNQPLLGTSTDLGDLDFSDVSSTYLRLVIEGLFGIRINSVDRCIHIEPGFPDEWDRASLTLSDIAINYTRRANA